MMAINEDRAAALQLVNAGLQANNLKLLGSALTALWSLSATEQEFYSILENSFGRRHVEILGAAFIGFQSVASWTSRLFGRAPEVVDGRAELHIVIGKHRGAYKAMLAELGVSAQAATEQAAERKLLLCLEEHTSELQSL
jgi:hypothetical protein